MMICCRDSSFGEFLGHGIWVVETKGEMGGKEKQQKLASSRSKLTYFSSADQENIYTSSTPYISKHIIRWAAHFAPVVGTLRQEEEEKGEEEKEGE